MKYESIADIYAAHDPIRKRFLNVVGSITDAEATALADGEKWTLEQVVEHVAIVEGGMLRICAKLIAAAREGGQPADGSFEMTDDFAVKTGSIADIKVEAPERVRPVGGVSIAESLGRLDESTAAINALKRDLSFFDVADYKFPHPYFGDLTAAEWLVIRGGHEHRHTNQIEAILAKLR